MSAPPTHIPLPPPPSWPDNFRLSPNAHNTPFFTPPTSPAPLQSPSLYYTPPSTPDHDLPTTQPALQTDDAFPQPTADQPVDFALDEDGLSTLEKIYLYSRSKQTFHRVFIAHALPGYLLQVTPQEAIEYVLPLLIGLAMDEDELVKEALAAELVSIIWWFFTHCQIIPDNLKPEEAYASSSTTVTISVQAFTPILGTLLLSSNPLVGGAARLAIVDLLSRMKKADDREHGAYHRHLQHSPGDILHPWEITMTSGEDDEDDEDPLPIGLFGTEERAMFTAEILQQVVIGMGRLDDELSQEQATTPTGSPMQVLAQGQQYPQEPSNDNPYFPPLPSNATSMQHRTMLSPGQGPERSQSADRHTFSPGAEFPPNSANPVQTSVSDDHMDVDNAMELYPEEGDDEQAAVGRLSSMSLMAAVTASGVLDEDTQRAFVTELERIGRDSVYWVRREASFALGALAKVVPQELVINSLLPLFDTLRWDAVWHVRHSALFALPALLTRLSSAQRRTVALETLVALSVDQNATVRSGVLEALGEVIYTFKEDPEGPPQQLLDLFLSSRGERRTHEGQQMSIASPGSQTPLESFYSDSKRPLICAFNFPAVALTLGRERWGELREDYLQLAADSNIGVRRTLAASVGELAIIIGSENAQKDLADVWRTFIKTDEEDVRMKSIESVGKLIGVVGNEVGKLLVQELFTEWQEGSFRSWRERETIEKNLGDWIKLIGSDTFPLVSGLLKKGLEDNVASVREAAVSVVPEVWLAYLPQADAIMSLRHDLEQLAHSSNYRRRMTFIACQQALALSLDANGQPIVLHDEQFLGSVANLAEDKIEGVRIGVARFAASLYGALSHEERPIPTLLDELVQKLLRDASHGVQSYVLDLSPGGTPMAIDQSSVSSASSTSTTASRRSRNHASQLATFSRPPRSPQQNSIPQPLSTGLISPLGSSPAASSHLGYFDRGAGSRDEANGHFQSHPPLVSGENRDSSAGSSSGPALNAQKTYFPSSEARAVAAAGANASESVSVPG
ncbi:ARM repeat-containing protein [Agrocybe pediades]|nr:ARM repeat-containing protein [Agrocybe pediades]